MPNENMEIVNLSKNRVAINFSKNAIAGLREGKSFVVNVKIGRKDVKFLFMRDSAFREKLGQFRQTMGDEPGLWNRVKGFFQKLKVTPVGRYKEVGNGR